MGITIREFQVAMEIYGAERLADCLGSQYSVFVPCFNVAGTKFIHSGSYYIVQREKRVPKEIMSRSMAEFGEKYLGGKNFWDDKIYSIRGILTLATMLDGKYSKELVDEMTNKTYKKLLDYSSIQRNVDFSSHSTHSLRIEKLYKLLAEYRNIANPFRNKEFSFKEPIQYLDDVEVTFALKEGKQRYTKLTLSTNSSQAKFKDDEKGWYYDTLVITQTKGTVGSINMRYYYSNGSDGSPVDEVVRLYYKAEDFNCADIDLSISLKTGLAWETYKEEQAKLATDEQIEVMITHLKISIKEINDKIVRNIINI